MSTHIGAKPGEISEKVLLPGDPLRARFIAQTFLENATCYSEVRGMYGFTGTYKGQRISVQGTGMGAPSISIYVHELIREYGAKELVRIGSCGAIGKGVSLMQIVAAQAASSDSAGIAQRFVSIHYASVPDYGLLKRADSAASQLKLDLVVAPILTSDFFYKDKDFEEERFATMLKYGIKYEEMETAELYQVASAHAVKALSLLTVSDIMDISDAACTAQERQQGFASMITIALETLCSR
ncbi:MAG: purine-nucleoside phosphorylase [Sphaerochaetaceae bacterium]|nr:purine-nucleoside phosphorylase [Sphaerochaetaceae bacterium]